MGSLYDSFEISVTNTIIAFYRSFISSVLMIVCEKILLVNYIIFHTSLNFTCLMSSNIRML